MYLFANSVKADTIACKPTSPQLVAVSCAHAHTQHFWFTVANGPLVYSLHRTV